jgi:hypothetical protein
LEDGLPVSCAPHDNAAPNNNLQHKAALVIFSMMDVLVLLAILFLQS